MSSLEKAIRIAAEAHAGTRDKGGGAYLLHPLRVMFGVEGEAARITAALHDVVEDTSVTMADLEREGFSGEVLEAVALLTHGDDQSYADYVVACKPNPIARSVKLADLQDNARLERVLLRADRIDEDLGRVRKYLLSYRFLHDELSEQEYRDLMVED